MKLNEKFNSKAIKYDAYRCFPTGTTTDLVYKDYIINKTTNRTEIIEDEVKIKVPEGYKLKDIESCRLKMVALGWPCVWDGSLYRLKVYNREIRLLMFSKG